jgi:hypothetical protein
MGEVEPRLDNKFTEQGQWLLPLVWAKSTQLLLLSIANGCLASVLVS